VQLDWRIVLFSVVLSGAAAFTALHTLGQASDARGKARMGWVAIAGLAAGAGFWATQFLAIRAYEWGAPTAYKPVLVALALIIGVAAIVTGFALALPEGRWHAAAGGAIIGAGAVAAHFVGMKALDLPGVLHPNRLVAVPLNVAMVGLCGAALVAYRELSRHRAQLAGSTLLTLAVCALHFVSVGATTVTLDPSIVPSPSDLSGPAFVIVVACTTALIMASAKIATLIAAQSSRGAAQELRERHEALWRREEELKQQNLRCDMALSSLPHGLSMVDAERRLVVCNGRFADMYGIPPELTRPGTPISALVDHRIATGLYADHDARAFREEALGPVTKATVKTRYLSGGRVVLVTRRPTPEGGWIAVHEDITEYRQLQETEREAKETLSAVFDAVPAAIICIATDRRVMLWSRGAEHIFGYTAEETVGQPYKLVPADGKAEFDGLFERALAGETLRDLRVRRRRKDGTLVDIGFSCAAMRDRDGAVRGIVYALDDLTEREKLAAQLEAQNELLKQREEALKTQNEQLDSALANMMQGLAMFDSEQRLVVCNRVYGEMYNLDPELMKPGTTARQILEHRFAKGLFERKDFIDTLVDRLGQLPEDTHRLADGRIIHVTHRRMVNGGVVITHEDITARERLNEQLQRQHRLLQEQEERLKAQNVQLDVALNNMVQGLAMFDADARVVIANGRYAELYGLAPDDVRPGTHLRDIIKRRMANGEMPGKDVDEVMRAVFGRMNPKGESQYTTRMGDGRYIAVCSKPMANGFTVTTHQDITEQRRSEAKIVHMALHDALTGLPNRVLFNERLDHALARSRRGEIVATHLLDLDHFKNVNDTLGHPSGDKLLQAVTGRLRALVRESDTIARMGGDEFAILQAGLVQSADAGVLARRVIEVISEPYEIDGQQVVIGTSVGIAIGPTDGTTPEQLMRNADLALYRAKSDGRGAFSFFEASMDARMQERRSMEYDLRKALVAGEFELHYQPIVNLDTSKISGFEALIRWRHPERGIVAPAAFIPLAEEIGFIIPLGEWTIRQACATAARWPGDVKVAVNLSPVQFRNSGLVQTVVNALAASGLGPERLELEITDTTLLQDGEATLAMLYQLREIGVSIAMDDFGTGYSSLSYLQSFPFDRIKIDRSFIKDITDGVGSLNIVRAVAALAKGLGMETTAEGVETELQRETVASEGCTEMQGFLFSRPRPAHEIEELYFPGLYKPQEAPAAKPGEGEPPMAARAGAR
jgi:diguanylate cyclase (GGDEF)-like protein/PAS domain S-box-containing protein